jgi:thiol:disulfide interchange protein
MPPAIVPRTNLLAVTAFVLGMLGLSLPALILGIVGRRQIDRSNGVEQGRWMATTGLILGIVFTALDSLFILFILIAVVTTPGY